MKHHASLLLLLTITVTAIPFFAFSAGFNFSGLALPTGGMVKKIGPSAELVCSAQYGPIFIRPVNFGPVGPFFIRTGKSTPLVGRLLLGNYLVVPDVGTCYNPATGVPIPAFEFRTYGTSR